MSKRYGRNQKQKHLAMIEKLNLVLKNTQSGNDKLQNLATDQFLQIKSLSQTVSTLSDNLKSVVNAIEAICEYSAALPPKKIKGEKISERLRISRLSTSSSDLNHPYSVSTKFDYETIDLFHLREYLQDNISNLSLAVHMIYSSPDSPHSKYMISKRAFQAMPTKILINQLLPEITSELLNYLKKSLKEKNKQLNLLVNNPRP